MARPNYGAALNPFELPDPERHRAARRSTWISVAVNVILSTLQIVIGVFSKSQALIADGIHSFSDLLSDFMVLYANRHSSRGADQEHPYGHARIETAATLLLGIFLVGVGIALLWSAGIKLQDPARMVQVHPAALVMAAITLVSKETLFRYLMGVAKRVRSRMLAANAWHSRSDAAASLVAVVGISGNLAGYRFLDLLAAALVGFMIARMGWRLGYGALSELVDTGLSEEEVAQIRNTLIETPGVRGLHDLRTRKMADQALVDAHVLVDPRISVSEGHYIAEQARKRVLQHHHVIDVMVHIDPEDDAGAEPSLHLPDRDSLLRYLEQRLEGALPPGQKTVLHYLDGKVEAEVFLDRSFCDLPGSLQELQRRLDILLANNEYFRSIQLRRLDAR